MMQFRTVAALAVLMPACALFDGLAGDSDDSSGGNPGFEVNCFDGVDDDGDGLQDCEDFECDGDPVCDAFVDCDGGPVPGSCRCVDDFGCDDLNGFVCHFPAEPGPNGACGPDCRFDDWCGEFGLTCMPDGLCAGGGPPTQETGSACLDGIDNDSNGLQDCEEFGCMSEAMCDGVSKCDGTGMDGGCACINSTGCDSIAAGFICHQGLLLCGSNCNVDDWCTLLGRACNTSSGQCL